MLKFVGEGRYGTCYFFGLSRENVNDLTSGQPIKVNLKSMGGPPISIALLFGETEQMLLNELKSSGLMTSDTEISPEV